jgi:RNA polymerase sigma-70 factor (ECF subfamily)
MTQSDGGTDGQEEILDFDAIVEKHADFVYNVAFKMMGKPEDAEDVAQDAFISAYRAFHRFRGESRVTTWLYRITVNAALMKLRKEKRARTLTQTGLEDADIGDWSETPERSAAASELGRKLQEAIALLQPDLRSAVVLRDVEGLSNTEASEALDITVSSLKSRLHRGRVLLRKYLADYVKVAQ